MPGNIFQEGLETDPGKEEEEINIDLLPSYLKPRMRDPNVPLPPAVGSGSRRMRGNIRFLLPPPLEDPPDVLPYSPREVTSGIEAVLVQRVSF